MISDKLKQIIFKELYYQLGKVEIIPYQDSIYFIHKENKYWYFEFEKCGRLWWRYDFFNDFFKIFSLSIEDYTKIISEWVEEVLNHKVSTTKIFYFDTVTLVEEVLNHKVSTTDFSLNTRVEVVEEILNHKVSTTSMFEIDDDNSVEEILSHTNK